jgi:uroporphyrin-III C-methyltransferase
MGLSKLKEIAALYASNGKPETPVAVISNGSLPEQKAVYGNFQTIIDQVQSNGIKAPGIIVIGEVVSVLQNQKNTIYQLAVV